MRINKIFSNYGICSRKEVNNLIRDKRIKVNGEYCREGQWIEEDDEILLDGEQIEKRDRVYIILNKPVGIVTTSSNKIEKNIIQYLNYPEYIFPVGRLDKESQGLILLTNDGEMSDSILKAENNHEKEYIVKVDRGIDQSFIENMSNGVNIKSNKTSGVNRISDEMGIIYNNGKKQFVLLKDVNDIKKECCRSVKTKPCKVEKIDNYTFKITLTQGLNRQIRKMSKSLGYNVTKLERIRVMNIKLGDLNIGDYRELNNDEIALLKQLCKKD